jgi:hypothetical protein
VWDVAVLRATGGIAECKSPETAVAADRIPGFGQARVEQLALAHPFETVKAQAQAP